MDNGKLIWDISWPKINERTGAVCFRIYLDDQKHEPVTFDQFFNGLKPERLTTAPNGHKGGPLPVRVSDDGLNGKAKGAVVQISPTVNGPAVPVRDDDAVH